MTMIRLSPAAKTFVTAEAVRLRQQNHFAALRFKANIAGLSHYVQHGAGDDPETTFGDMKGVWRGMIGDYVFFYQVSKETTDILTMRSSHSDR